MKRANKPLFLIFGFLVLLNILAWIAVYDLNQENLEVIFFDVGQGDATFIQTYSGHRILIDGGPGSVVLEKLGNEMPFWDRSIDLVILTHPHYDHLSGLVEVIKNYQVKNVLWTGVLMDTVIFGKWEKILEEKQIPVYTAQAGQRIYAGSVLFEIIYPFENLKNREIREGDNTSVVVKLSFGKNSFLFTGDAFQEVEIELVEAEIDLNSNVLQVGHHGSRTSSAPNFIEQVLPEIAVISAGRDNRYGHPHPETLETLALYGITVLSTTEHGDIKIISDGKNYGVSGI